MKVVALFFLLLEVVMLLPRINGIPVNQPNHFPIYQLEMYSQNDTQLQLSNENISDIPINAFENFSALKILNLSGNNLTYDGLPCGSLSIATLRYLITAGNQIKTVPSCLPAGLELLDLSKNFIRQIRFSEFTGLQNLEMLHLSHNKISEIVPSEEVLTQLASLDLSYNNLTKLQWKFQMPNLIMLKLEGNPLQQLKPYEFSHFPKLHSLNLSMTSLEVCIYKVFASGMENLKILDLSANLFKTYDPQCFEGLNNLQFLWMRQMPFLQSLPADLFANTPNLVYVNLERNSQLHFMTSSMFEFLIHLEFLSLKSCNLTEFRPWNFFTNSTVRVILSDNPLVCSCELTWLMTEPDKVLLNRANDTTCLKNGAQTDILLTDLIYECNINGNQTQELQVKASTGQTQPPEQTIAGFHYSSGNVDTIPSSKLPIQFSISTPSPNSTILLNAYAFHGWHSNSNPGTLQTEASTGQNDQNSAKSKSGVKFPTWSTTARDQTGIKHYATSNKHFPHMTKHDSSTTTDQTGAKHHATTLSVASASPKFPSISPAIKRGPIFLIVEDNNSESLKEEETARPVHAGDCNYDPCRHWQVPCHDLRHLTGCSCPGISGPDIPPDPVKIQKVIKISDNSAEIYWCAPSSTVLHYYIIYQSDDNRHLYKTDIINPTYRRYTLHDLTSDSTYHTCVVAVNKAGSSSASSIWPSKGPCYIFKTKPNYNNIFYIASTAIIAILFILVIILSICLWRICQKVRLTDLSQMSLNPLALQNPAFDNHLEMADPRTFGIISADSEEIP
ncbi:leucine-rich repeat neuronal protein 4-like [Stegostoma tigrinum]|uniref:leucine-rich repeat neuronal protein 4-like n=1 Tax=Stegostoma tigrinum TaxID=3053191 RepID=UPI00286FB346|nr:leucine-rich repeat neuronal protein 4-like [Stegostoma tigrinum]